ncbi:hypothetical protein CDCA_CDCA01G0064 [Cyanidium caldarium]|uniref:Uncharacterized protein n=1 Tax=Cyanidium caldarium TaxID=2771 RepID=A0AAV9IP65_CYACA|nr:hypothetical protein CDCA_CDCA01G0064 [Cyanidium caldarium]
MPYSFLENLSCRPLSIASDAAAYARPQSTPVIPSRESGERLHLLLLPASATAASSPSTSITALATERSAAHSHQLFSLANSNGSLTTAVESATRAARQGKERAAAPFLRFSDAGMYVWSVPHQQPCYVRSLNKDASLVVGGEGLLGVRWYGSFRESSGSLLGVRGWLRPFLQLGAKRVHHDVYGVDGRLGIETLLRRSALRRAADRTTDADTRDIVQPLKQLADSLERTVVSPFGLRTRGLLLNASIGIGSDPHGNSQPTVALGAGIALSH